MVVLQCECNNILRIAGQKNKTKKCRCGRVWKLHFHPKEQWYNNGIVGSGTCKDKYGVTQVTMYMDMSSKNMNEKGVRVVNKRDGTKVFRKT